jgi:hypothetical protein
MQRNLEAPAIPTCEIEIDGVYSITLQAPDNRQLAHLVLNVLAHMNGDPNHVEMPIDAWDIAAREVLDAHPVEQHYDVIDFPQSAADLYSGEFLDRLKESPEYERDARRFEAFYAF